MTQIATILTLVFTTQQPAVEPAHQKNAIYRDLIMTGWKTADITIRLPEPKFRDGMTAESQKAAIREVARGDRAAADLMRDSVTAPFVLKLRDEKAGDATIRYADLWFVVYADFDSLEPGEAARESADKSVEAANMKFESKLLTEADLRSRKIPLPEMKDREWYVHLSGELLDRIAVEGTDRVLVTRSAESLVVGSRTDSSFDNDKAYPNVWHVIAKDGNRENAVAKRYFGGASYVKMSRLRENPRALMVEGHFAFVEPREWFDGAPILRSKFSPIAQDQIRKLRREVARKAKR